MRNWLRGDELSMRDHIITSIACPVTVLLMCMGGPVMFWGGIRATGISYELAHARLVSSEIVPSYSIGTNSSKNKSWELKVQADFNSDIVDEVGINSRVNVRKKETAMTIQSSLSVNGSVLVSQSKWLNDSYIVVPNQTRFLHIFVIVLYCLVLIGGLRSAFVVIRRVFSRTK